MEHYWLAVLCHTDHTEQASLFLLKRVFAAMQRFSPALDSLFFLQFSLPTLGMTESTKRDLKRPVGRLSRGCDANLNSSDIQPLLSCLQATLTWNSLR